MSVERLVGRLLAKRGSETLCLSCLAMQVRCQFAHSESRKTESVVALGGEGRRRKEGRGLVL
jgi:hypothetical protein